MMPPRRALFVSAALALVGTPTLGVEFARVVIDDNLPGAYQVEVADVNGDGKPDVVALGGGTVAWYENPSWKKRVITGPKQTPGVISTATADLDGDGKAEVAVAYEFEMNNPRKGKLLLARQGKTVDDPWTVTPITHGAIATSPFGSGGGIGGNPAAIPEGDSRPARRNADIGSIHRLRWGYVIGTPRVTANSVAFDRKLELVVAPIFGTSAKPPRFDQEPAHLLVLNTGADPLSGRWSSTQVGTAPVLHAIDVVDVDGDGKSEIFGASNLGVTRFDFTAVAGALIFAAKNIVPGAQGEAPKKGASEVHTGRLKDGRRFLTTVEPWHGSEVAVYLSGPQKPPKFGPRAVIDNTLDEGHALWVADVDGDGDDEIFAGHRGKDHRVSVYDHNARTGAWDRTVIDRDIAAQDLRGGDLDGDGTPDVVAVGGSTRNVVWYRPVRKPR